MQTYADLFPVAVCVCVQLVSPSLIGPVVLVEYAVVDFSHNTVTVATALFSNDCIVAILSLC